MTSSQYPEELAKVLLRTEIPDFQGASGYFSKPQKNLDPALFDGTHLKPDVRMHVINTLCNFWLRRGYHTPAQWTTVWIAGSGASYQWAGDRGNGDLDVLMGIDWPRFYTANPQWGQTDVDMLTEHMDDELRQLLWPRTAHTELDGKVFEVTYFVNPDASDIRNINPYAAYNLTTDQWTVTPSRDTAYDHPGDPQWLPYAENDRERVKAIRDGILWWLARLPRNNEPERANVERCLEVYVGLALDVMTDIHGNRHKAFANPLGHGYWDFNNWRWQMAKKNGLVKVLGALENAHKQAEEKAQRATYGAPLAGADQLIIRAAMASRGEH